MRLLDRYLLRELLIPLGYCLGGLLIFWIACDLLAELDEFQQERLGVLEIAEYYLVRLPELLDLISPVALLLALLYTLTHHARHHELIAMRAAGVGLWRLCLPYLAVGLVFSLLLHFLTERWLPNSAERADQIRKQHARTDADDPRWQADLAFRNDQHDRFWRIPLYNVETGEMLDPFVQWNQPNGPPRELQAERGVWTNKVWTFYNVSEFVSTNGIPWRKSDVLSMPEFTETPEQIRSEIKVSRLTSVRAARKVQLTVAEILDYKRLHPRLDSEMQAKLDTQLHARLASPWTSLVVVLIAVPFGAPSGRRNVFVGVAAGIFICFVYFVLQKLGLAFGTGGHLPPLVAAWLPNAVFGGAGAWMISRVP